MNKILKKKTALITGGSKGIGKAIVETFCKQGANVMFTFNKSKKQAISIEKKFNISNNIISYKYNAEKQENHKKLFKKAIKKLGKIDILVNNIGINKDNLLINMKNKEWLKVQEVNINSIFYITKYITKHMIKRKKGNIINISSIIGFLGNVGQCNYSTTKYGIIGFTKSLSKELASSNIRCNVIAPGFIKTSMTKKIKNINIVNKYKNKIPLKRFGEPQEIANVCLFLASKLSSYITGEVINVSGGINNYF